MHYINTNGCHGNNSWPYAVGSTYHGTGSQMQDKNKTTGQRQMGRNRPGKVVGYRRHWDKFTEGIGKWEKPPQREHSWIEWETPGEGSELTPYTDGASNNQGAEYGFAVFESNRLRHSKKGPLGRICPYQVELFAVRAALNWLVSNPQRLKDNVILYEVSRNGKNQNHCFALGDGLDSKSKRDLFI